MSLSSFFVFDDIMTDAESSQERAIASPSKTKSSPGRASIAALIRGRVSIGVPLRVNIETSPLCFTAMQRRPSSLASTLTGYLIGSVIRKSPLTPSVTRVSASATAKGTTEPGHTLLIVVDDAPHLRLRQRSLSTHFWPRPSNAEMASSTAARALLPVSFLSLRLSRRSMKESSIASSCPPTADCSRLSYFTTPQFFHGSVAMTRARRRVSLPLCSRRRASLKRRELSDSSCSRTSIALFKFKLPICVPSGLYYHTSGFVAWFKFPPEHLVELRSYKNDPDIIARVFLVLVLKLNQET